MTANSDDTRSAFRRDRSSRSEARNGRYMIAPSGPGSTQQMLIDRLARASGVEIVRTHAERGAGAPPVAVVRMSDENAAALRRAAGGTLIVEPDRVLRAASLFPGSQQFLA